MQSLLESNGQRDELGMKDFTWRVSQSGNPNKAWIVDDTGKKLSALMSLKAARELKAAHNIIVVFLTDGKAVLHE